MAGMARREAQDLLWDIKWVGIVGVYYQGQILKELKLISERIKHVATDEQVAALTAAIGELETATESEIGQINARIDELLAQAGDDPDPALDAAVASLAAVRERIAGIIPDAAPEPAPEPPAEPSE